MYLKHIIAMYLTEIKSFENRLFFNYFTILFSFLSLYIKLLKTTIIYNIINNFTLALHLYFLHNNIAEKILMEYIIRGIYAVKKFPLLLWKIL